jgi:hypothetical protein
MESQADIRYGNRSNWDRGEGYARPVFLFRFRAVNNNNDGIAARVYLVNSATSQIVVSGNINQAKRETSTRGAFAGEGLTVEEIEALARAGMAQEVLIHENLTVCLRLYFYRISNLKAHLPRELSYLHLGLRVLLLMFGSIRSVEGTQL